MLYLFPFFKVLLSLSEVNSFPLNVVLKNFLISKCDVKELCLMSKTWFCEHKFLNVHTAAEYFQKLTFELVYLQGLKHYFQSLSRGRLACYFQGNFAFPPTSMPRIVGVTIQSCWGLFSPCSFTCPQGGGERWEPLKPLICICLYHRLWVSTKGLDFSHSVILRTASVIHKTFLRWEKQ